MRNKTTSSVRKPSPQKKRKNTFPALEWLEDISGKAARATAIGSRKLLVENYTGILAFSQERVRLNTGCGPLAIEGSDLYLQDVRPNSLIVHGEIHRVELPCEVCSSDKEGDGHAQ